ncbi:MAG: hypothetical protein JO132_01280 [Streptosporangiaceae bacterium]|nr:hypothetical protein [Streptosporangiaceae bacterium]
MRKNGWAAAAGAGSLAVLLAACGGSPSTTSASSTTTHSGSATASATAQGTATRTPGGSSSSRAANGASSGSSSRPAPQPQGSAQAGASFPPPGTTVMVVQRSILGFVMAEANHQVVYIYAGDKKGGTPTCTGSCAQTWPAVTGIPKAGPSDKFPGTFGTVRGPGGVEQITYDGMPLYRYAADGPFSTTGNGADGMWYVIKLSASDIG